MPPKRSVRSRPPSASAVAAAASGTRGGKRSRANNQAPVSADPTVPSTVPANPVPVLTSATQQFAFPPGLIDNIVAKVTDEVTKRLATASSQTSVLPQVPTIVASSLHEMPVSGSQPSSVTSLVQDALTVAQSALSGEPSLVGNESLPEQLFTSPSLAIDSRVSDKLRSKIWNNEYFEFGALLSNPVLDSKYQITINKADKGSALCLEPISQTKKFLSIETWLKCFHVFVGVYTRKYPNEAPDLMKYGEVVQDLAARGHNWKFYDENFRFLRQSQPTAFPWINIHWELWMRSQQTDVRKPIATNHPNQLKLRDDSVPKGYCFKFSRGVKCFGCAFKHLCYKCEGSHPPRQCTFRAKTKVSNSAPLSAKSQPNKLQPAKL